MATMRIPDDLRDALDAERITWAEAGQARDLRKAWEKAARAVDEAQATLDAAKQAFDKIESDLAPLEAKIRGGETPST